ncbi:LacI family DNA-binding transcriptional regulator [Flammeovirga sp. OC4]|uniref:LacI family DNA-binding transcriptional regulator n=1 Tax=Flammeovirga sp. OC4 TaxID=1382345 RepID=UPI0005C5C861|nr:LacI family DNA-binding transcriptional regulator [Flammeovirga sp. OC4]
MKTKGSITIKDLAKELGVSPTTISRALNGGERISEKTRKKVEELAKKYNYRPNMVARNLQKQSTKTVGVIIPEFNHNFFSMMLHGVEEVARTLGYQMMITTSGRNYEQEKKACFSMADAKVDGILIALSQDMEDYSYLNDIRDEGIPIVLLDRICEDIDTSVVITDDFSGAFKAVDYLLDKGHRKILHMKGDEGISTTFNRYMGYVEAFKRKNLKFDQDLVISGNLKHNPKDALKEKLLSNNAPTAIFASSDYLAFMALETISTLGLKVPEDIAIIGYADEPISRYSTPKLSTIKQPSFEMGKKALELLFEYEKQDEHKHMVIDTELVVRESC